MNNLFSKGQIGPLELKNRVVLPPMCMFISDDDGFPNEFHYTHYLTRAINQVGLIILEATAVSKQGRITDQDLGIWSDEHIDPLKRIVDDVHKYEAKIAIQLAHAGRKCGVEKETNVGPSATHLDDRYETPIEMTKEMIEEFINDMVQGAIRADKAGFDAIEIHAAHGYLLNQFLTPLANVRTDEYGGSLKNRSRLLVEVVNAVRAVWPKEKALWIRISAEEYAEGSLGPNDLVEVISYIPENTIDAVNVSTGGVIITDIETFPGYQTRPAEIIKEKTGYPTMSGGLIYDPLLANEIVANNRADFVYIGRGLLYDDAWTIKAQKTLGFKQDWPTPYERSLSKLNL